MTACELTKKISSVLSLPMVHINQVYKQGPTGIHILLSDQVSTHLKQSLPCYQVPRVSWPTMAAHLNNVLHHATDKTHFIVGFFVLLSFAMNGTCR